jgi:hypothetical protein
LGDALRSDLATKGSSTMQTNTHRQNITSNGGE